MGTATYQTSGLLANTSGTPDAGGLMLLGFAALALGVIVARLGRRGRARREH